MTNILQIQTKIKKRSNTRPKSLILYIPSAVRDIMKFENNTDICLEVCMENDEKLLKIRKID